MVAAGQLNSRIEIQEKTGARDSIGQVVQNWSTKYMLWASIRHLSGVETVKSGVEVYSVQASVRIRTTRGITAGMRIKAGSLIYDILAVLPDAGRTGYMDLVCKVGVNEG